MATTYTLISSVTVGSGGAANMEFTSIPATYTDLVLLTSLRTNSTVSSYGEQVNLKFNGSTSNFTSRRLEGFATTAQSSTETDGRFGRANNANASQTVSTFSNAMVYIPNYAGSTNKSWSSDSATEQNGNFNELYLYAGLWSQTAAITSISIVGADPGNFVQYSTATLYGIKNS